MASKSKFSLVLRMIRENAGLTQQQLADTLGIERSTYAYYESAATEPNIGLIIKLSKMFNIDYSVFMDAVADVEFDTSPVDPEFTTNDENSEERVEKLNKLSRDEQRIILRYRLLTPEQKKRYFIMLADAVLENDNAKKEMKKKTRPPKRRPADVQNEPKENGNILADTEIDIRRKRRKFYDD